MSSLRWKQPVVSGPLRLVNLTFHSSIGQSAETGPTKAVIPGQELNLAPKAWVWAEHQPHWTSRPWPRFHGHCQREGCYWEMWVNRGPVTSRNLRLNWGKNKTKSWSSNQRSAWLAPSGRATSSWIKSKGPDVSRFSEPHCPTWSQAEKIRVSLRKGSSIPKGPEPQSTERQHRFG